MPRKHHFVYQFTLSLSVPQFVSKMQQFFVWISISMWSIEAKLSLICNIYLSFDFHRWHVEAVCVSVIVCVLCCVIHSPPVNSGGRVQIVLFYKQLNTSVSPLFFCSLVVNFISLDIQWNDDMTGRSTKAHHHSHCRNERLCALSNQ